MRPRPAIGLLILATFALPAAVSARTVKLPENKPLVSFEIPDDWTLTPAAGGMELSAPDHTAVIEVGVVKRAKRDIIAWQKGATQRMKAFGVSFDPKRNPLRDADGRPGRADPTTIGHIFDLPPDRPDLATEELPSWSMAPPLPQAAVPAGKDRADEAKTAEGKAPEIKTAEQNAAEAKAGEAKAGETKAAEAKPAESKSAEAKPVELKPVELKPMEAQAAKGGTAGAAKRPRFRSLVLYGGVLDGKPVDVEFLDFSTTGALAFVMQQESSATDERAGAVVNSVRFLR